MPWFVVVILEGGDVKIFNALFLSAIVVPLFCQGASARTALHSAGLRFPDGSSAIGGDGSISCTRTVPRQNRWRISAMLYTTGSKIAIKPNSITDGFIIKVDSPKESEPALGYVPPTAKINYHPKTGGQPAKGWNRWNFGRADATVTSRHFKIVRPTFRVYAGIALTKSGSRPIHFYDIVGYDSNYKAVLANRSDSKYITCIHDPREG